MDFFSLPGWLDAFLIAPFRWPDAPYAGMWLGSAFVAFYCLILGEVTYAVVFSMQRDRFIHMQDEVLRYHNLSVDAIHAGDKDAYLAANSIAHEKFGTSYFALAGAGMASIWPVPFALAWMSLRFEGIDLYHIPGTSAHIGYVFVLVSLYILERVIFSRLKKYLPFFSRIEKIKEEARRRRGAARHFLSAPPAEKKQSGATPAASHRSGAGPQ